MKNYEKPVVMMNEDVAEGVYAASGVAVSDGDIKCDSKYMNGEWQVYDTTQWLPGETRSYKQQFGCHGCRAYTGSGCGLQTHFEDSTKASSYEGDDGIRMPIWESKGYAPDDTITDWNC